jgi:hypothetical protein
MHKEHAMNKKKTYPHIIRGSEIKENENTFSHPWNPKSEVIGTHMSRLAGLTRTGLFASHPEKSLLPIIFITVKKSGHTLFLAKVSRKLMGKSTNLLPEILLHSSHHLLPIT